MMKNILTVLLVLFILGQFIRPTHNISAEQSPNDIERHYQVPTDVRLTLEKACRDCHSNNTRYPWYYNIQPVAWWLNDHIVEGKKHFNLSEFAAYPPKKADHKLEELIESQTDHWMPLESYQKLHADARLTEAESQALIDWASAVRDKIQTTHPEAFVKK
ncbi:heme-binding protein [Dyadobacter jejuensis]|uniref:Heme-binding protein n=1 Tax=Dyadobacter jejuensis TaxID=1082580 RepID=A0A316AR77_9BACT|nr:heme-binding domain-containing protein [Dyadobacter jejuensis]PWJ60112.1 heme-binding protein [Dyadobacter jejuensis]